MVNRFLPHDCVMGGISWGASRQGFIKGNSPRKVSVVGWREWEWAGPRPPQRMRSLHVRGWAVGKPPEDRGGGAKALFGDDGVREGGIGVQLQVGDGNPRGPCLQRPGGCF